MSETSAGAASITEQRLNQVNEVLASHDLATPFTYLGDVDKGEVGILGAERVVDCGEGLYLVELPAQFTPDTVDPQSGNTVPGKQGKFWTFFNSRERDEQQSLIVPFVGDAPQGYQNGFYTPQLNTTLESVNSQLREAGLKPLPVAVNALTPTVTGVTDIVGVNSKFFSVVILEVKNPDGSVSRKPFSVNANSIEGVDGTVFATTIGPDDGRQQVLLGNAYRPTIGERGFEATRGFYSPSVGEQSLVIKGLTDIPTFRRLLDEVKQETGLTALGDLRFLGTMRQDPEFEITAPAVYGLNVASPEFGRQELEDAEKIRVTLASYEELYSMLPGMLDAFTIGALARELISERILILNDRARAAQEAGEQLVLARPWRVQYGEWSTEVIRGRVADFPVSDRIGTVAVNTGTARIMSGVHTANGSWSAMSKAAEAQGQRLQPLYPYEALRKIACGELDMVTTTGIIKALRAKGYLSLGNKTRA